MNANPALPPSSESVLAMIRGELSPARRWAYRLLLVVVCVIVAGILSLWTTEPGPLPVRLHVAFAALTAVGGGWIGVLTWILTRRRCPTAGDRVATAWMSTVGCTAFLIVAVAIAAGRGEPRAALALGLTGFTMLAATLVLLRGSYELRNRLRSHLAQLEGSPSI